MNNQTTTTQAQTEQESILNNHLITAQAEPSNSIKPSIEESERFIQFLNDKFNLNLNLNDLIVMIHETKANTRGYFKPCCWKDSESNKDITFKQQQKSNLTLSSYELKKEPYMVLTHELAHFINFKNGIQDTTKNGYHNKHFKAQAEQLLLTIAERDARKGYTFTTESNEFKEMLLTEFKPSKTAFKIFQEPTIKTRKQKSRMLLYVCNCNSKIRTARNINKPLKAVCEYCESEFKEVIN